MQMRDTFKPELPNCVYFIRILHSFCPLAFIAASITDWADGYVARRNNMVTSMGKFLDPLADKVLICSVLIMFCTLGWAEAWVVILIVCRELVVTGLRAIAIDEGIVLAADRYGKLKTVLQIAAIIPMLLHYPYWGVRLWPIGEIILYLALIMSVVSCVNYCYGFYRKVAAKNAAE